MNHGANFTAALGVALLSTLGARADSRPDFDEDAKPILRSQPGLVEFVRSHYQVKETGLAKYPGDDDRRPAPPYIFYARPVGSTGSYTLRLLIQPGPPGHILGVVDASKVHAAPERGGMPPPPPGSSPYTGEAAPPPAPPQYPSLSGPAPANPAYTGEAPGSSSRTPAAPAPSSPSAPASSAGSSSAPTADTPSGPINAPEPSSNGQPALAPPPDPAPSSQ